MTEEYVKTGYGMFPKPNARAHLASQSTKGDDLRIETTFHCGAKCFDRDINQKYADQYRKVEVQAQTSAHKPDCICVKCEDLKEDNRQKDRQCGCGVNCQDIGGNRCRYDAKVEVPASEAQIAGTPISKVFEALTWTKQNAPEEHHKALNGAIIELHNALNTSRHETACTEYRLQRPSVNDDTLLREALTLLESCRAAINERIESVVIQKWHNVGPENMGETIAKLKERLDK